MKTMLMTFEIVMLIAIGISVFGIFGETKVMTYRYHIACGIAGVLFLLAEVARHFIR